MQQVNETKAVSVLSDEFMKSKRFHILFLSVNLVIMLLKMFQHVIDTRYFNQRLLNFNQYFTSHGDYIIFIRSLREQYPLRSLRNFAMHKVRTGTNTAGTVKNNLV